MEHERPGRRIALAAREHPPGDHSRRERRYAETEDGDPERMPQDLVDPVSGRVPRLADGRVCPQQAPRGKLAAAGHDRDGDDDRRGGRERAEPQEWP